MAIRFALGDYQTVDADPLGRDYVGCFPRMTQAEAWEAGRGVWKINARLAARERFALVTGHGVVLAAAEITGITAHGDRKALEGTLLGEDHPLYRYVGGPDPLPNASRNRVAYGELPEETAFKEHPCACGCGEKTIHDFCAGHELKAVAQRARAHFGGSTLAMITWMDTALAADRQHTAPDSTPAATDGPSR